MHKFIPNIPLLMKKWHWRLYCHIMYTLLKCFESYVKIGAVKVPTLFINIDYPHIHFRPSGDFDQKPYVSGDADCSTTPLSGDEDYVLLACDGFFDAVKHSEVPQLVLDAFQHAGDSAGGGDASLEQAEGAVGSRVAQHLVSHAKAAGSSDNITVMLVFLRPLEQLLAQQCKTGTV